MIPGYDDSNMILCLWIIWGLLTIAVIYLAFFMNEQDVRRHITAVVGEDRPLKNRHFLGVVAGLVLLELVLPISLLITIFLCWQTRRRKLCRGNKKEME